MERDIETYVGKKFQSNDHLLAYLHAREAVETAANDLTIENHKAALDSIIKLKEAKIKKDPSPNSKRNHAHFDRINNTFVSPQPKFNSFESRKFKYHRSSHASK